MDKPPIGVSPHWFVYMERMNELNEAIKRHLDYARNKMKIEPQKGRLLAIAAWCEELKQIAMLEATLEEMERSRQ